MASTNMTSRPIGERSVIWLILICGIAVGAIIAISMSFLVNEPVASDTDPASNEVAQDPTGAGTSPDGVVDEQTEGLMNETATEDLTDSSANATAPELGEGDESGPDPATSAEEVEPAVGNGNVEQMTPADGASSANN